jgi:uncharacterized protein YdbL (DUF1318 family)
MKVDAETRDLVREISRERALDYDETIRLGMAALRREARREQMRRESASAAADPEDRAEVQRVLRDMEAWGAR